MRTAVILALVLVAAACVRRTDSLPEDIDGDLDKHDARAFCDRWAALGDPADPMVAFHRAEFAVSQTVLPLREGTCLSPAQFRAQALQSAETAAKGLAQSPAAWSVLAQSRLRFADDRSGAADAGCRAAELTPGTPTLLDGCGDLLLGAGRRAEALERWKAAALAMPQDAPRFTVMEKMLANTDRGEELLASFPPEVAKAYEQWKREQAALRAAQREQRREEDAKRAEEEPKPEEEDEGPARTPADEWNERVRQKARDIRDSEPVSW